jgi:hypothetical protein
VKAANAGFGAMTLLKREEKETSVPNNSVSQFGYQFDSIQFSSVHRVLNSVR